MARKKSTESKIDVNGLSINDIMNLGFDFLNSLQEKDIKKVTSRLVSAANKRIRRLRDSEVGKYSPSLDKINKMGRMFSVEGKNTNQVRNEFKQVKAFLQKKTSTISGYKAVRKKTMERLGIKKWDSPQQERDFWSMYREIVEIGGGDEAIKNVFGSNIIQLNLRDEVKKGGNREDIMKRMYDKIDELYIQSQDRFIDEDDEDDDDVLDM